MFDWLRCVFHDLFGHPVMNYDPACARRVFGLAGCGPRKVLCYVCWHHYTVTY